MSSGLLDSSTVSYVAAPLAWPEGGVVREAQAGEPVAVAGDTEYLTGARRPAFETRVRPEFVSPVDELYWLHGDALWDWMLLHGKVSGSVNMLREAILADGIQWTSGLARDEEGDSEDADAERSEEICEAWCRCVDGLAGTTPLEMVAWDVSFQVVSGAEVLEKVWTKVLDGPDAGAMDYARLKVKPRRAWAFVCDDSNEVAGFLGVARADLPAPPAADGLAPQRIAFFPRDKFGLFSWMVRESDPRGTKILRPAYLPWNFQIQLDPEYFDYCSQFAAPTVDATPPEKALPRLPLGPDGKPIPGARPVSPEADMRAALESYGNSQVLVRPWGSAINLLQPSGNGEAFVGAFEAKDREIVFAITQQSTATLEAKHGNRAQGEVGRDVFDLLVRTGKMLTAASLRRELAYPWVLENYGPDAARRMCPRAKLGKFSPEDLARIGNALAALWQSGFFDDTQRPELCSDMGWPAPGTRAAPVVQPAGGSNPAPASPGRPVGS